MTMRARTTVAWTQHMDSMLGVVQSYFWQDRLVTTFGYREDQVKITQLGFHDDPVFGDVVDHDPAKFTVTKLTARTESLGAVFHVTNWLSLIAIARPTWRAAARAHRVPVGQLAPLSHGQGQDFGLGLDLLEGRVSGAIRLLHIRGERPNHERGTGRRTGEEYARYERVSRRAGRQRLPFSASQLGTARNGVHAAGQCHRLRLQPPKATKRVSRRT
jgi:hypothetical protein